MNSFPLPFLSSHASINFHFPPVSRIIIIKRKERNKKKRKTANYVHMGSSQLQFKFNREVNLPHWLRNMEIIAFCFGSNYRSTEMKFRHAIDAFGNPGHDSMEFDSLFIFGLNLFPIIFPTKIEFWNPIPSFG